MINPKLTAGEARKMMENADLSGMSKVNPSMTRLQAYQILMGGISKLADNDVIVHMISKNIQREFGKG